MKVTFRRNGHTYDVLRDGSMIGQTYKSTVGLGWVVVSYTGTWRSVRNSTRQAAAAALDIATKD